MTKIALIEDDADIAFTVRLNLERENYRVTVYGDGHEGLVAVQGGGFDFVILDLNLPDVDGLTICRELRRDPVTTSIPILMLTARGSERDRITGLELGADDYLTKPFSIEELLARIVATLRRTRPAVAQEAAPQVLEVGDVVIDLAGQQVTARGQPVHLTPTEFALLRELAVHRGKLLSRSHLLRQVWGQGYETETEYVRVYISRLRAKLEPPGSRPLIITRQRAGSSG